ncbi:MAG: hypothetical protein JWM33_474 [Caulobacteraceae bacterium]|nr:hypothetical protein [Caulobacteraceae bacterium]
MAGDVDTTMRGPQAYGVARQVLELMEAHQVWPTALNYEIWTYYVVEPDGALARELARLIASGDALTESVVEELASTYLPKARLNDQIRDAGQQLNRELLAVSEAIRSAQTSTLHYGETLADADRRLKAEAPEAKIQGLVDNLIVATRNAVRENHDLEQRLALSSAEVERLREHLEQVRRDATTDGLTNLANRKAFDEELARTCQDADMTGEPMCLAVLDIDYFKSFNDTWGHQTGDQVIRYVASVLAREGSAPRFAARYGGEEFAIIFPGEDPTPVFAALERVRIEISSRMLKRRSTNEDLGTITISAGLGQFRAGESPTCLMERADAALYTSKRTGRNRVTNGEDIARAA